MLQRMIGFAAVAGLVLALAVFAGTANAAFIAGVTVAGHGTENTQGGGRYAEDTLGPGFNDATGEHDANASNAWETAWSGRDVKAEWIAYDLGANYNLESFTYWNYNCSAGQTGRGIETCKIYVSSSASATMPGDGSRVENPFDAPYTGWTQIWTGDFEEAPGIAGYTGETPITLTGLPGADDVRLFGIDIVDNQMHNNSHHVGLSEIRFTEVPEPATLALVLLGLPFVMRRKRR